MARASGIRAKVSHKIFFLQAGFDKGPLHISTNMQRFLVFQDGTTKLLMWFIAQEKFAAHVSSAIAILQRR